MPGHFSVLAVKSNILDCDIAFFPRFYLWNDFRGLKLIIFFWEKTPHNFVVMQIYSITPNSCYDFAIFVQSLSPNDEAKHPRMGVNRWYVGYSFP